MGSHRGLPEILSSYQIILYQAFQGLLYSISWKSLRGVLADIAWQTQGSWSDRVSRATIGVLRSYNLLQRTENLLQRTKSKSKSIDIQINLRIRAHKQAHSWHKLASKNGRFSFLFFKYDDFSVDKLLLTLCVTLLKSMWIRCVFICSVFKSTISTIFPKRYPLWVWTIISR